MRIDEMTNDKLPHSGERSRTPPTNPLYARENPTDTIDLQDFTELAPVPAVPLKVASSAEFFKALQGKTPLALVFFGAQWCDCEPPPPPTPPAAASPPPPPSPPWVRCARQGRGSTCP